MFLVIEGIDGAGKGRQRIELLDHLSRIGVNSVDGTEFPDHQGLMYKNLIKPYLLQEIDISKNALFLSFALDQLLFQERIAKAKGDICNHFICDGYFSTNLVYNSLVEKILPLQKALRFADDFNILQPDLSIFIDVDPEIALLRKSKESGHDKGLDINERDLKKQHKIRKGFLYMAKNNVFGKWLIVDGNGSIEQVRDEIIERINKAGLMSI